MLVNLVDRLRSVDNSQQIPSHQQCQMPWIGVFLVAKLLKYQEILISFIFPCLTYSNTDNSWSNSASRNILSSLFFCQTIHLRYESSRASPTPNSPTIVFVHPFQKNQPSFSCRFPVLFMPARQVRTNLRQSHIRALASSSTVWPAVF